MSLQAVDQPQGYVESEQVADQVVSLMQQGEFEGAARLYMRAGDACGFPLINRFAADADMSKRLANVFYRAKDYSKAANICENLGEDERAAELYDLGGDPLMAAEAYVRFGDKVRAADRYERSGNARQAAQLFLDLGDNLRAAINYEKAGEHFDAGKNYYLADQSQKAIELLQHVDPESPDGLESTDMISAVLVKEGYGEMALHRLRTVFESRRLGDETMELYYRLGELEATDGDLEAAKRIYEEIASMNFGFREVGARLKEVEARLKSGPVAAPAPTPDAAPMPVPTDAPLPTPAPLGGPLPEPSSPVVTAPLSTGAPVMDPAGSMTAGAAPTDAPHTTSQVTLLAPEIEDVAKFPIFADLALQDVRTIFSMFETKEIPEGETLIQEGVPGAGLFLVKEGLLRVLHKDESGEEVPLANLPRGAIVGEMSLLDDSPTSGRVVAAQPTTVLFIAKDRFQAVVQTDQNIAAGVYRAMVRTLSARLRATTRKLLMQQKLGAGS